MNRIVGNVLIVDSAMGNAIALTSANQVVHMSNLYVSSIAVWSANTTAAFTLTEVNTATDLVYVFNWFGISSANATMASPNPTNFAQQLRTGNLKVPVVTACTAFLYLA